MTIFKPFFQYTPTESNVSFNDDELITPADLITEETIALDITEPQELFDNTQLSSFNSQQSLNTPINLVKPSSSSNQTVRGRNKRKQSCSSESSTNKVLEYLKNRNNSPKYDDIDLLFLGYAKTIKKFSPSRQIKVKYDMASLIMRHEQENHRERSPLN